MKEKISEDLVSSDLVRDLVSSDLSGNYDKVRLQIDTALDCLDNDQKEQLKQATSKKEDSLHAVNDKGDVEYNGKIMGRDNAILQIRADYIVSNSENLL